MNHTPTPWELSEKENFMGSWEILDGDNSDNTIAMTSYRLGTTDEEKQKANAEFIVRACNSHDELVKALKEIASYSPHCCEDCPCDYLRQVAEEAIAKAEGKAVQS